MKRLLIIFLSLLMLGGCVDLKLPEEPKYRGGEVKQTEMSEFIGLWITIYELSPKGKTEKEYVKYASEMMKNISSFGFTDIFVQVRANCDSIYYSDIFPPCYMYAKNGKLGFDALGILCEKAHENKLNIHAWINPYRICTDCERQPVNLPKGVKKSEIVKIGNGRYLNPCSEKTSKVISDGIREIIENYDVDGIHIDDYFYPGDKKEIDEDEYKAYIANGGKSSLPDYRRGNVSSLVSSIYSLVKSENEKLTFSISPGADIYKDKNSMYADVPLWCGENGYCDMIIPQIYFGFKNESKPFKKTFNEWKKLTEDKCVRLCIGLAIYKHGKEDKYAGESGKDEWKNSGDIIKRQVEYVRENEADGFCVFSYDYIFGNRNFTNEEVQNLKSVI